MVNLSQSIILDSKSMKDKLDWCIDTATSFGLEYTETDNIDIVVNTNPTIPTLIVVTNELLDVKQQNILLKTIEEPFINAYYVLVCNVSCLIETLRNRLTFIKLHEYTKDDLRQLTDNELFVKYADSPDDIELFNSIDLNKIINISSTIINKLDQANFANSLVIKNTISENPTVFIKVLLDLISDSLRHEFNMTLYRYYLITKALQNKFLSGIRYNTDHLLYNYVIDMWGVTHGH